MQTVNLRPNPLGRTLSKLTTLRFAASAMLALSTSPLVALTTFTDLNPNGASESYINAGSGQQQVGRAVIYGSTRAALWSGTPLSFIDLTPPGSGYSELFAISGSTQGGYAYVGSQYHAGLWSGTANSFVDVNPAGATASGIYAINGSQQVGYAGPNGNHAALWQGTAASFMDLGPEFPINGVSFATGTSGSQQVGNCPMGPSGQGHACLWSGAWDSVVDLNPAGALYSSASSIDGQNQGGYASVSGQDHAALWSGSPDSFVDLHPAGASKSDVYALNGSEQVGRAYFGATSHAALWSGTAQSFVDLHPVLGSGYTASTASAIWTNGNITYVGGWALPLGSQYAGHAILWTIQQTPAPHLCCYRTASLYTGRTCSF